MTQSTNFSRATRESLVYKAVCEGQPLTIQGVRYWCKVYFHQHYTTNQIHVSLSKLRKQGLILCKSIQGTPVWVKT